MMEEYIVPAEAADSPLAPEAVPALDPAVSSHAPAFAEAAAVQPAAAADAAPIQTIGADMGMPVEAHADQMALVQEALLYPFPKDVMTSGRMLSSKWAKTAALLSNPAIVPHIPPTRLYSEENLAVMLEQHGMVVIKPVHGTGGAGIIKISRADNGYSYTINTVTRRAASIAAIHRAVKPLQKGRAYLIQKGIQLATVGGRPIDYRVKVVKNRGSWEFRSMVGRIARAGLFVTNLCRGGRMVTSAYGISRSLPNLSVAAKKQEMRNLTLMSVAAMESKFPGVGQLGFDYGLDRSGKIWIFEVNTRPK